MRAPILLSFVLAAGCTTAESQPIECGAGTHLEARVCVVDAQASDAGLLDGAQLDGAAQDASFVDSPAFDATDAALADSASSDASVVDGSIRRCDPSLDHAHCDAVDPAIISCDSGRVVYTSCAAAETCRELTRGPTCVPADATMCDSSFEPLCDGSLLKRCNTSLGFVSTTDCAASGLECAVLEGEPNCVGSDVSPCDRDHLGNSFCASETEIRYCGRADVGDAYIWQTVSCEPAGTLCVPPRDGLDLRCVPPDVELCAPATYVPSCGDVPEGCTSCGPGFDSCRGGVVYAGACEPGDECVVLYVESGGTAVQSVVCRQPGALPCDRSYAPWCDDVENSAVECDNGFIRRTSCGADARVRDCFIDEIGGSQCAAVGTHPPSP